MHNEQQWCHATAAGGTSALWAALLAAFPAMTARRTEATAEANEGPKRPAAEGVDAAKGKKAKIVKAAAPLPMTAAQAEDAAKAEGLTLVCSNTRAGYKGVKLNNSTKHPFTAAPYISGCAYYLGRFATAEAAALAIARLKQTIDRMCL